jgi:hypothetical protein
MYHILVKLNKIIESNSHGILAVNHFLDLRIEIAAYSLCEFNNTIDCVIVADHSLDTFKVSKDLGDS